MANAPFPEPLIDASGNPTQTLQAFTLAELIPFTKERSYSNDASKDFHLFFVGRDDVHDILRYVISRARVSLYLNMFGYDDDQLNAIIMKKVMDPSVTVVITLDKSQSGGKHEKALLDADKQQALAAFNTHFTIGQSLTHQISHTKGFVVDSKVGAEGSTNWSDSGQGTDKGTFFVTGSLGGAKFAAQNNTQTIFTDPDSISRFQAELIAEHLAARDQEAGTDPSKKQIRPAIGNLPKIRSGQLRGSAVPNKALPAARQAKPAKKNPRPANKPAKETAKKAVA
jgi:phosphatidylserine/phosphatidylglycerophosphate/cardiolipin synthase-like enzyme